MEPQRADAAAIKRAALPNANPSEFGMYNGRAIVEEAIRQIKSGSIQPSEITVLRPQTEEKRDLVLVTENSVVDGVDVSGGAVVGGAMNWLAGAELLAIPGIGIVVAAGPLFTALVAASTASGVQQRAVKRKRKSSLHERVSMEREQLEEREQQYALAFKGANDGLWDWNLKTGEIFLSSRWKEMLGFADHEVSNHIDAWFPLVHPEDLDGLKSSLNSHIQESTTQFQYEYRMLNKHGQFQWMLCRGRTVRDETGTAYRMAGAQTDITTRKNMELKLSHDVFHDSLTGLPNRALFMERLKHAVTRVGRREGLNVGVLFIDLDRFKVVNDSLGHSVGDQLLVEFARRVGACLRPGDTLARLGGDEFCVILEDVVNIDDANMVASRIQEQLKQPIKVKDNELFVTASMGIALSTPDYQTWEDLLRDADIAMYRAKTKGQSSLESFETGMHTQAKTLQHLESGLHHAVRSISATKSGLHRAVESKEFLLEYQPIVSLLTGRLTGFEALIRWQHPTRGRVLPNLFVPIAEETDLIVPITYWVLRDACAQMRQWQLRFPKIANLSVNVNLSAKSFSQSDLIPQISKILDETGLSGSSLKIEITERVIMKNAYATAEVLANLKSLGLQLCLDDFGTGYSSLSYLHSFPLDSVKIDRSFISKLSVQENKTKGIMRAIMSLARNLNMAVVAEGVETQEQLSELRGLNCDYAQGYFFSRPVDAVVIEKLIEMRKVW